MKELLQMKKTAEHDLIDLNSKLSANFDVSYFLGWMLIIFHTFYYAQSVF